MKTNKETKLILLANLSIFLAVVFWGLSFVSMKSLLITGFPPFTMILIRYMLVCFFLVFLLFFNRGKEKIALKDYYTLALSGFIGVTCYFLFESKGIQFTTASNASVIIATIPIFSLLVDVLYYKNPVTWIQTSGIVISFVGVFLIILPSRQMTGGSHMILGNILMLGACLSWVLYSIFSKQLHKKVSNFTITAYQSIFGAIFLILPALTERSKWIPIQGVSWFHFLYLALLCSLLSYFLYNYSLRHLGLSTVSVYINLIPVVGVIGGVLLLGETVHPIQIIGGGVVILSLFLVNQKRRDPVIV
jgi:drug/metabolite transporter (DMT)-like permease